MKIHSQKCIIQYPVPYPAKVTKTTTTIIINLCIATKTHNWIYYHHCHHHRDIAQSLPPPTSVSYTTTTPSINHNKSAKRKKRSNATLDVIDFCYLLFIQSRSDNNSGNAQHPYWRVLKSFLSSYESFKLSLLSLLEPINLNSRKKRRLSSNSYLVVLCN